jgi:hypothetical protein
MQLNVLRLFVAAAGLLPAVMARQTYSYTSVDYPNAPSTSVSGINSKGDVVGFYEYIETKGSTLDLGFVRGANGTFKTFEVPGATETAAVGISDSPAIVGYYTTQNSFTGFLYAGTNFRLYDPSGGPSSLTGISTNNLIVGFTATHSFEIKGPGQVESLPELNGKVVSPLGINSSGTIVGSVAGLVEGVTEGFILDPSGTYQIIQYPESTLTSLSGINDAGVIVGSALGTNNISQGFVYSQGQFTEISYPGSTQTSALGINNSGVVSGTYYGGTTFHGLIATPVSPPSGR